jgi:hypothetical protein
MDATSASWLTIQDLARLSGFSASFIRAEIRRGALYAICVCSPSRPRTRGRWRIAEDDARAYLTKIGLHGASAA